MNLLTKNILQIFSSYSYGLLALLIFAFNTTAQNSIVKSNNESGSNINNIACKKVTLKPGYKYNANLNNTPKKMLSSIDQNGACDVTYIEPTPPDQINQGLQPLDKNLEVGATTGTFSVSEFGSANYTIQLQAPPGTMGMEPRLGITYNSNGGNGLMGVKWSIAGLGLSAITRAEKNIYLDEKAAPITLSSGLNDVSDRFTLDGQRLMVTNGNYGAVGALYDTEAKSFVKIQSIGGNSGNPDYFIITTKDGTQMEYGNKASGANSYVASNGNNSPALMWLLNKITDANGNTMIINYQNIDKQILPQSIDYAGNQVKFIYNYNRLDPQVNYIAGYPLKTIALLNAVEMYAQGEIAHSYTFNYSTDLTSGSHLTEIIEAGSNGKIYNSTKIDWSVSANEQTSGNFTPNPLYTYGTSINLATANNTLNNPVSYTGDFNGDGLTDAIYLQDLNTITSTGNAVLNLNNGKGTFASSNFTISLPQNKLGANPSLKKGLQDIVIDFNGDGLDDFFIIYQDIIIQPGVPAGALNAAVFLAQLTGNKNADNVPEVVFQQQPKLILGYINNGLVFKHIAGDFDGNGTTDLVRYNYSDPLLYPNQGNRSLGLFSPTYSQYSNPFPFIGVLFRTNVNATSNIEMGTNLNSETDVPTTISFSDKAEVNAIDADGDGKDEILITEGDYSVLYTMNFPQITLPGASVPVIVNTQLGQTSTYPSSKDIIWKIGDFNGDGKKDILSYNKIIRKWQIGYASLGSKGLRYQPVDAPFDGGLITLSPIKGSGVVDTELEVLDLNSDGKSDIFAMLSTSYNSGAYAFYSMGDNKFQQTTVPLPNNQLSASPSNTGWVSGKTQLGDFNGDGHTDIALTYKTPKLYVQLFQTSSENITTPALFSNYNKVTRITNGLNTSITIDYNTLPQLAYFASSQKPYANYTKGNTAAGCSGCNIIDLQYPLSVTSQIKMDNGIGGSNTTQYSYSGAQYHLQGRGFLGFLETTTTDIAKQFQVKNTFYPFVPAKFFQPLLHTTQLSAIGNGNINLKTYEYTIQNVTGLNHHTFLSKAIDADQLTGNTLTTTYAYDALGNNTSVITNDGNGKVNTTVNNFDNSVFPISKLNYTTFNRTGYSGTYARRVDYTNYNSAHQPQTITTDLGKSITTLTYFPFGGVNTSITTGESVTQNPNTVNTYDNLGRFIIAKKTTVNGIDLESSYTYDNAYGNVLTETDANGLTTLNSYDGFGKLIQSIMPTGQNVDIAYNWLMDDAPTHSLYQVTTSSPTLTPSTVFYDKLNRSLRSQTFNFDGSTKINVDNEYNATGQLVSVTEPYSGSTIPKTTFTYDFAYRPLTKNEAGGATVTFDYNGNSTQAIVSTGSGQKALTNVYDAMGQLITATDDLGGTLTYSYHNSLNPIAINNNGTSTINLTYDNLGRRLTMTDPNIGQMSYSYDGLGQLLTQTDPEANVHTMAYDALGRIVSNIASGPKSDGDINYYYDTKPKGKGLPASVVTTGALTGNQEFTYDDYSRLKTMDELLPDGNHYVSVYAYDNLNRITKMTYPNGYGATPFAINHSYQNGYLNKITNAADGSLIWQCTAYNQYNNLLQANLGSGGVTTKTYTSNGLGLLTNSKTVQPTGTAFDYNYNFDATNGNLLNRTDNIHALAEGFTGYDKLDRLTTTAITVAGNTINPALSLLYAPSGNITSKSDAGQFEYNNPQPHAISGIINPTPAVSTIPQDVKYTSYFRPYKITQGDFELKYSYGPDYDRKKSELKNIANGNIIQTVLYADNYDKITIPSGANAGTYEVHYINTPDGLVAANVRKNNSADHLYYLGTDHLGSILNVYDPLATGNKLIFEQSFDAWGRQRDPNNNWDYTTTPLPKPAWLIRGYTGHEMLPEFGLVNMNARLYDPVLGRMLSPDNYVQAPDFTQSYNRYTYVFNNPLKFIDPTGNAGTVGGGGPGPGFISRIIGGIVELFGGTSGIYRQHYRFEGVSDFFNGISFDWGGGGSGGSSGGENYPTRFSIDNGVESSFTPGYGGGGGGGTANRGQPLRNYNNNDNHNRAASYTHNVNVKKNNAYDKAISVESIVRYIHSQKTGFKMTGDEIADQYSKLGLASSLLNSIEKVDDGLKVNFSWAGKLAIKASPHDIPNGTVFKLQDVLMKDKSSALQISATGAKLFGKSFNLYLRGDTYSQYGFQFYPIFKK